MLAGDDEPGPLPVFTEEDERREKADLIPSEVIDAECDLRGLPVDNDANNGSGKGHSEGGSSSTSKSSMDQQLSMLLHELVALPGRDKAAYLQAVIRCPNQANSQSHQAAMLQREEYGAKRAAKRIARYWEERKLAFGEARAFLPMTLHGALGDDVASMLESRIYHVLADRDDAGRTILSCDLSRVDSTPIKIDEEVRVGSQNACIFSRSGAMSALFLSLVWLNILILFATVPSIIIVGETLVVCLGMRLSTGFIQYEWCCRCRQLPGQTGFKNISLGGSSENDVRARPFPFPSSITSLCPSKSVCSLEDNPSNETCDGKGNASTTRYTSGY